MSSLHAPILFLIAVILLAISARTTADDPTTMTFYSRRNRNNGQHVNNSTIPGLYNWRMLTVFIVHGFTDRDGDWMEEMKNAFIDRNDRSTMPDYNVILVNWDAGTTFWYFGGAVANMDDVGDEIAAVAKNLINRGGSHASRMYCIGHSLGAHVCAHASDTIGFRRITGLDPAKLLNHHLRAHRAEFVDVIHTSSLGVASPTGHVDFYPNGGQDQPGCNGDEPCEHRRAYDLYIASLRRGCFKSKLRVSCESKNPLGFQTGCRLSDTVFQYMGYGANRNGPRGSFELNTSESPPYCRPI